MIISSNQVIWKAEGVHPQELIRALSLLLGKRGPFGIDVDILSLYFKARYSHGHNAACDYIAHKFLDLALEGFAVTGVIDGTDRPDCKRSSWEQAAEVEFARLNAHFARQKACALSALVDSSSTSFSAEATKIKKEIKKLNSESLILERKHSLLIPNNLKGDIEDAIFRICIDNGRFCKGEVNETIIKAKYQADSMIAYRVRNGISHVSLSEDTDFPMILGPDYICIKKFETKGKKCGVKDPRFVISGCSPRKMKSVKDKLQREKIVWSEVKYPVFDTKSPVMRSLVAIALGCDVWKGIKGFGPAKVWKFLDHLPPNLTMKEKEELFVGYMIKMNKDTPVSGAPFDRDLILCLSSAILDEAVVEVEADDGEEEYNYMFGIPSALPEVLGYFSATHKPDDDYVHVENIEENENKNENKEENKNKNENKDKNENKNEEESSMSSMSEYAYPSDADDDDDDDDDGFSYVNVVIDNGAKDAPLPTVISANAIGNDELTGAKEGVAGPTGGEKDDSPTTAATIAASPTDNHDSISIRRGVAKEIEIFEGPPYEYCNGILGITQPHFYLKAEGRFVCEDCSVSFCRTCGFVPQLLSTTLKKKSYHKDKNKVLCYFCYKTSSIGEGAELSELQNVSEMKETLDKMNIKIPADALAHEIEDIYEHYVVKSNIPIHERRASRVDFPFFSSAFFSDIKEHIFYTGSMFSPDSDFLNDSCNRIPDEEVPKVIELFASLVDYEHDGFSPYSAAVPAIISEFANMSRPPPGPAHKLIKSCMRHATDDRMHFNRDDEFSLFHHQCTEGTSVGFILHNKVPASMKDEYYDAKVAFTRHNLLACKCTCLAGGKDTGDDKVTCVHNLPLLCRICIFIHQGYGTNLLHMLAARWDGAIETMTRDSMLYYNEVRRCILVLMKASCESEEVVNMAAASANIPDMLETYQVTTQRKKCCQSPRPSQHELIPCRCLPVESFEAKAKRLKTEKFEDDNDCSRKTRQPCKPDLSSRATTSLTVHEKPADKKISSDHDKGDDKKHVAFKDGSSTTCTTTKKPHGKGTSSNIVTPAEAIVKTATTATKSSEAGKAPVATVRQRGARIKTTKRQPVTMSPHKPPPVQPSQVNNLVQPPGNRRKKSFCYRTLKAKELSRYENMQVDTANSSLMPTNVSFSAYRSLLGRLGYGVGGSITNGGGVRNLWLTDEIINDYGSLLNYKDSHDNPNERSYVFNTQFYFWLTETNRGYDYEGVATWSRNFPEVDIFNKMRRMVVPICQANVHWAEVFVDLQDNRIAYGDSNGSSGKHHIHNMLRYFKDYAKDHNLPFDEREWTTYDMCSRAPQQGNAYDCGTFILLNAYLFLHDIPFDYDQERVDLCQSRRIIAYSVLSRVAHPPITIGGDVKRNLSKTNKEFAFSDESSSSGSSSSSHDNDKPSKPDAKSIDALNRVRQMIKRSNYSNLDKRFQVDWLRNYGWLKTIYGKDIPTKYVGINAVVMRAEEERVKLRAINGINAEKIIKQKERATYSGWRKLVVSLTKNKEQMVTNGLRLNTNGWKPEKKDDRPTMTFDRKYGKKTRRTCVFKSCSTNAHDRVAFERILKYPAEKNEKKLAEGRPRDIGRYYRKVILAQMARRFCGVPENSNKDLRVCALHRKKLVTVTHTVPRENKRDLMFRYTLCLPVESKEERLHKSRGLGEDRFTIKEIKDVPDGEEKNLTMFAGDMLDSRGCEKKKRRPALSRGVRELLDIEDECHTTKLKISCTQHRKNNRKGEIRSFNLSDDEIKRRTGFQNKKLLLAFMGIACNADLPTMLKTTYNCHNFWEEWFLAFELIWGRSWVNQVDLAKEYRLNARMKNNVVDGRLYQILDCRNSWPMYLTHEEDVKMRAAKWADMLDVNDRVVMHDTTDIPLCFKPSLPSSQKITFNRYYGGNCVKEDVALQPSGFIRTNMLWVGGTSDSMYMKLNGIFEEQDIFQNEDLVDGEVLPFMNILDRGYKLTKEAFRCGKQTVRQPVFKEKKKRFTGNETLRSASCASVRSGNERAVRKAKLSGFLKKGLRPGECPERLDNVNLAWGFMVNFMYASTA